MASRTPSLTSDVESCPSRRTLKGSPGDAKRMMKTTKLTPRSRSAVIVSSLDSTSAMGRTADNFMVMGDGNGYDARSVKWSRLMNSLIIMTTLFYKIPPHLPLPKGGIVPLFGKEGRGEILVMSIQF
jgi:hypothetical protein